MSSSTQQLLEYMLGGEFYVDTEYDKKTVTCFWIPCKMRDTHKDMYRNIGLASLRALYQSLT